MLDKKNKRIDEINARTVVGWCENDSCGEPIYKFDIHFIDGGEMYCDNCHIDTPIEEI